MGTVNFQLDNFDKTVTKSYRILNANEEYFNVTLVTDDAQHIAAHQLVLSSSSDFFKDIIEKCNSSSPCIYLSGVNSKELYKVLDFIYEGKTQVQQEDMDTFMTIVKILKINGIKEDQKYEKAISHTTVDENVNKPKVDKLEDSVPWLASLDDTYDFKQDDQDESKVKVESQKLEKSEVLKSELNIKAQDSKSKKIWNCQECGKSKSQHRNAQDCKSKKIWKCKDCGIISKNKLKHEKHRRKDHPDSDTLKIKCTLCKKVLLQRTLKIHMDSIHNEIEESPSCNICGKICEDRIMLFKHMKRHIQPCHTKEEERRRRKNRKPKKPLQFNCDQCKGKYSVDEFDDHICEKPSYICNVCGATFQSLQTVNNHHKNMHVNIERKFGCDTCGMMFKSNGHLTGHMRTHQEKQICSHCGLKFSKLSEHIANVHTPDELKSCICPDCGKGFTQFSKLKAHQMNVHIQLRPYKCRTGCDATFNDRSNRGNHERKTHGARATVVKQDDLDESKVRLESGAA